jgi:hypothetical protein
MDRMINSAPMSGGMSDSAYDRSEDAVIKMQTCENCKGHGVVYFCGECDENIEDCECGTLQDKRCENCDYCDGDGEVEL